MKETYQMHQDELLKQMNADRGGLTSLRKQRSVCANTARMRCRNRQEKKVIRYFWSSLLISS